MVVIADPRRPGLIRIGLREREGFPWTWAVIDPTMADQVKRMLEGARAAARSAARTPEAKRHNVPDVVGIDLEAATELLAEQGLDVEVSVQDSPIGHELDNRVIRQRPPGGAPRRPFSAVQLTVSSVEKPSA